MRNVTHTRNSCSAFNPSKVHTHSSEYTHREHTPGAVGSHFCCGARGAVGGSVPCSRVSPQSWYWGWRERCTFTPPTYNSCRTWCFRVVVAQQWHGRDVVWGFGKRTVGGARDIFSEVTMAREKAQVLYAGCVHFTVDWLFWNLYGSYIAPRPLLSWKKPGNFSFDNMGPLNCFQWLHCD